MNAHAEINAGALIQEYVGLRDSLKQFSEKVETIMKERFGNRMIEIENMLLGKLEAEGAKNISSKFGVAMKVLSTSVTTADGAVFRSHVIDGKHWDLVDWRPNKTTVKRLVNDQQPVPPGLNYKTRYVVNVRKGSS